MKSILHLDFDLLESKTDVLKTMGHPIRLSIVECLVHADALTVTEIYSALDIEQAVASHHLRIMKNANVVQSTKDGKNVFYKLADPSIKMIFLAVLPLAN